MRSYEAARRRTKKAPVTFGVDYEVEVRKPSTLLVRDKQTGEERPETIEQVVIEKRREEFSCTGEVSSLTISELVYNGELEITTPEGMMMAREVIAGAFGNDAEYQRFFRFAQRHLDDDDLGDILQGLIEDFTGRPTGQFSDSSAEPSGTGGDSTVVLLPGGYQIEAPQEAATGS